MAATLTSSKVPGEGGGKISPAALQPFMRLGILIVITALFGLFIGARLELRGQWLPQAPNQIGAWEATDTPLDDTTVKILGNPKTLGRQYHNPFEEQVQVHVIATASFDAYHEPPVCMAGYGYSLTAETFIPMFGPKNYVRAMILKSDSSGQRVMMLYWIQNEDGTTSGRGNLRNYSDLAPRLKTGVSTATTGQQSVIVRIYTTVNPLDNNGRQARRNLWEVSRGLYEGIKKDGATWRSRPAPSTKGATQ